MTTKLNQTIRSGAERNFLPALAALILALGAGVTLVACGGGNTAQAVDAPEASAQPADSGDAAEAEAETDAQATDGSSAETEAEAETNTREVAAQAGATNRAPGFAAGVTGGAGGPHVRVTTVDQLKRELCRTFDGNGCTDHEPRVIEVAANIDLTASEGIQAGLGCIPSKAVCAAPMKHESLVITQSWMAAWCGKQPITGGYRYSVAGLTKGMLVGSNKTVIGVVPHAGVRGKGFVLQNHVSNIIIRNLSITDINEGIVFGGDAIHIAQASRVWIDHNYIARIGRQHLVSGWGKGAASDIVDKVTVSYNEFDGRSPYSDNCDGTHYWMFLLAGHGRVSFYANYIHDFRGRGPHVDPGKSNASMLHIVNNVFEHGTDHAIDAVNASRVLMEGNVFSQVNRPVASPPSLPDQPGQLYGLWKQSDASRQQCKANLGRICSGNVWSHGATGSENNMTKKVAALQAFKSDAHDLIVPYSVAKGNVEKMVKATAGIGHVSQ